MRRIWFVGGVAISAACALPVVAAFSGSSGRTSSVARPPSILTVEYGRFRPKGAERSYTALRVRARDPNGQIVAMEGDAIGHADGGCNLGGKRRGDIETWTLPTHLSPGRHRLSISIESSSCDKRRIVEETTSRFRLIVWH